VSVKSSRIPQVYVGLPHEATDSIWEQGVMIMCHRQYFCCKLQIYTHKCPVVTLGHLTDYCGADTVDYHRRVPSVTVMHLFTVQS